VVRRRILPTTPSRDDLCCRLLTPAIPSIARGYHRRRRDPYGERLVPDGQVRRRVRAGMIGLHFCPDLALSWIDRQAGWQPPLSGLGSCSGNAGSGLFRPADPEQTIAWHAYLDKDNWGSANGCHLSTGSRLPVPPIEPQLQRSICERRVPTPGHRVGGDGTKTRGPRQVRRGGRYMATLPAVARLRRGALDRDDFSSKHHPALIFSTRGA
jgi:hypothetical protein